MKSTFLALAFSLVAASLANGRGILLPEDKAIPPLAMVHHRVDVALEDQVGVTRVEQTFRNHTSRALEATYVFPVPRGASAREFAMWVDGKRVKGELVEAAKARRVYTDIVRRLQDPGLLEYLGADLLQMRVFPLPPRGQQKIELSYTALAKKDHELIEYTYPVRTDGKCLATLDDFTLKLTLKSQHPILSIYSPTHAISITRANAKKNTARTRVFTFGVGHDLDAALLDQIAEQTRAASTFVRPSEDLEAKVSSFFDKIRRPVLTNLKLTSSGEVRLVELCPPQFPDLFHGGQLVLLGRYQGEGSARLKLTGSAGGRPQEFEYRVHFPSSVDGKPFVEDLWARRKVGYLLEQIRLGGEKKELVDSVVALAKKYGIATPYTSYLVVPDVPVPVVPPWRPRPPRPFPMPTVLQPLRPGEPQRKLAEVAGELQRRAGDLAHNRGKLEDEQFAKLPANADGNPALAGVVGAREQKSAYDAAQRALQGGFLRRMQTDKLGVDLSVQLNNLKNQSQLQPTALRRVAGRNCLEIGGVWIDEGFDPKQPSIVVKAMSDGYFHLLERQPQLREVFQLGNHLVWVAPSGTALVIDTTDGKVEVADAEIDRLFTTR